MTGLQCYDETIFVRGVTEEDAPRLSRLTGFDPCNITQDQSTLGQFSVFPSGKHYYLSTDDNEPQSLEFIAEILRGRLLAKIATAHKAFTFLRGDSVKLANGSGVLLVGPSISGKTRLSQALIANGATPWSVGASVLNSRGEILRFPFFSQPTEGLSVRAVAMLTYEPGAPWQVELLSPGQTVLKLTANLLTASLERQGEIFGVLGQIAAQATLRCEGTHSDTQQVLDYFKELISAS